MSLEYYLFYRNHYESIINNLDDTINSELDPCHKIFLIERKEHITKLKTICDNKILELCNHEFEDDMIDITPDSSKNIKYCKICGYTK
jgi:hypothetical protein